MNETCSRLFMQSKINAVWRYIIWQLQHVKFSGELHFRSLKQFSDFVVDLIKDPRSKKHQPRLKNIGLYDKAID